MYKYYKNIGLTGETCGEVLARIMDSIWSFFEDTCGNQVNTSPISNINIDYSVDYNNRHDHHTTQNLIDPLVDGSSLFGQYFSMNDVANSTYHNIAFTFSWLDRPVIMYVPNKLSSRLSDEYDLDTDLRKHNYPSLPYICFTFNPAIFSTNVDQYSDQYSSHKLYKKISYDEDSGHSYIQDHYGGLKYESIVYNAFPIWIITPFSTNNRSNSHSLSDVLDNNFSMFISLENHAFILGFVEHKSIDEVHYSFISGMPDTKGLPGCDFKADFLVRSDMLAYRVLESEDSDVFTYAVSSIADDRYSRERISNYIHIMAVNATVDSNIENDLIFSSLYEYNFQSYKNVKMFDNYEKTCWVNRFLPKDDPAYFLAGGDGNILVKDILVPTLRINLQTQWYPYKLGGTVVTPSVVPGRATSSSNYITYQGSLEYHRPMFPTDERNTLNSHIILLPAFVCVLREPVDGIEEYSPICKLDFIVRTNVMYHNNRGIFELNTNCTNYILFTEAHKSYNIGIAVGHKLEPAI